MGMITLTELILALCLIESSLDPNAIGDGGDAVGILQIHECVILDVNRIYGTEYNLNDRYDPMLSKMICRKWLATEGRKPSLYQASQAGEIWQLPDSSSLIINSLCNKTTL